MTLSFATAAQGSGTTSAVISTGAGGDKDVIIAALGGKPTTNTITPPATYNGHSGHSSATSVNSALFVRAVKPTPTAATNDTFTLGSATHLVGRSMRISSDVGQVEIYDGFGNNTGQDGDLTTTAISASGGGNVGIMGGGQVKTGDWIIFVASGLGPHTGQSVSMVGCTLDTPVIVESFISGMYVYFGRVQVLSGASTGGFSYTATADVAANSRCAMVFVRAREVPVTIAGFENTHTTTAGGTTSVPVGHASGWSDDLAVIGVANKPYNSSPTATIADSVATITSGVTASAVDAGSTRSSILRVHSGVSGNYSSIPTAANTSSVLVTSGTPTVARSMRFCKHSSCVWNLKYGADSDPEAQGTTFSTSGVDAGAAAGD
jgi:hypothetical protein